MSPIKSIRYEDQMQQVLDHLKGCQVCLSRVTALLTMPVTRDPELLRHVRLCAAVSPLGYSQFHNLS